MSEATVAQPTFRIKLELARLLVGIDTEFFENGVPDPYRTIGQRVRAASLPDRHAVLQAGLIEFRVTDPPELVRAIVEIDPTTDEEPEVLSGDGPAILPAAVPFPMESLPRVIQEYVRECADSLNCPPDFVAVPILTCAGAAIGTSVHLQIKADWYEWPLLFTAIVGPSGSKKTPAKSMATRFTHDKGVEYHELHREALENFERLMAEYQHRAAERLLPKSKKKSEPAPDKPTRPVLHRTWLNDSTMEAIAQRLRENPRGLVLLRDELAGLLLGMNQYRSGRGADLQNFLSLWSCDPVTIDRKTDPDPIVLDQPFLAITGGIQPGLLPKVFGGDRLYDGFTPRFLFAHPEVMPHRTSDAVISEGTLKWTKTTFDALYLLSPRDPHSLVPQPQIVRLTSEARALFNTWADMIGARNDALAEDDPFRATLSKMAGQVGRLAVILHSIRWASKEFEGFDDLSADTMRSAISLGDYFVAHARRVWAQLTETREDSHIRRVLSWMRAQGKPVTKREIQRSGVGGFKNAMQVDAMVRYLVECDLIESEIIGRTERYGICRAGLR